MAKSDTNDLKAKQAAELAEARAESKVDQNLAAVRTAEQAEAAVKDGVDTKVAASGVRTVKVMVKEVPNNGIVTLNNVQLRVPKAQDVLTVPYAFYAAFPQFFALIDG